MDNNELCRKYQYACEECPKGMLYTDQDGQQYYSCKGSVDEGVEKPAKITAFIIAVIFIILGSIWVYNSAIGITVKYE